MADCIGWNPLSYGDCAKQAANDAVAGAVSSGVQDLGKAMMGAWDGIIKSFLTSWLGAGLGVDLGGVSATWLTSALSGISVVLAIVGIMIACIWTMLHMRGDRAKQAAQSLFTVFLTTMGTALVQVLIPAGDSFAAWILDQAGVDSSAWSYTSGAAVAALAPGIAVLAGIFGFIATLCQWVIMLIRAAVLPLLVAVWPVTAAASMIRGGEQMFSKVTGWMVAFLVYKPIAAIVYAFAWKLKGGSDGIGAVINGMILLVLAVVALPAVMRLIAPATSALGAASGGSAALAAGGSLVAAGVAVGAAVATGGGSTAATTTASADIGTAGGTTVATEGRSPAGGTGAGSTGGETGGATGASGAQGSSGAAGAAGEAGEPASSGGAPGSAGGAGDGFKAGVNSLGGSVAQGAQDSDGTGVVGG
ncbi:hypothetical protein [Sinomonas terrae]|uniref:TrbL/VirB6 plasmid conjugal transfer protein n=1 Tax=Sinomonas terrae TaxID=2908838 RepID=A0ABS9U7X7_9MICC|nr:hypothetical protein [Sinomonas terrae]MCH6472467.1 hypothetical protein [Sinomonas terrae]